VIASVQFKHFKALRATSVRMEPFNLVIGPNGSGKTSLIQACLRMRALLRQPLPAAGEPPGARRPDKGPEIVIRFAPPYADITVHLGGRTEHSLDFIEVRHPRTDEGRARWEQLRDWLGGIRAYLFDHYAMAEPVALAEGGELASNGRNIAAVLAGMRDHLPDTFRRFEAEFCRALPDFTAVDARWAGEGRVELALRLREDGEWVTAENISQGGLYALAVLTLSFAPQPPTVLCLEEADRGVHPRLLREVRDALYRLSYPESFGERREAVQIVATTHSPYLLDLFRDHPEEIVIANKSGRSATFERLGDRPELKAVLGDSSLGDLWFSGILGGVPEDE